MIEGIETKRPRMDPAFRLQYTYSPSAGTYTTFLAPRSIVELNTTMSDYLREIDAQKIMGSSDSFMILVDRVSQTYTEIAELFDQGGIITTEGEVTYGDELVITRSEGNNLADFTPVYPLQAIKPSSVVYDYNQQVIAPRGVIIAPKLSELVYVHKPNKENKLPQNVFGLKIGESDLKVLLGEIYGHQSQQSLESVNRELNYQFTNIIRYGGIYNLLRSKFLGSESNIFTRGMYASTPINYRFSYSAMSKQIVVDLLNNKRFPQSI